MNTTESYQAKLPLRNADDAELISSGLMPNKHLTRELVQRSAAERIGDLRAIASVVAVSTGLASGIRDQWQVAMAEFEHFPWHLQLQVASSPIMRRWLHAAGRVFLEQVSPQERSKVLARVGNYCVGLLQGKPTHVTLRSHDGIIETWDCKVYLSLPSNLSSNDWQVECKDNDAILHFVKESCQPLSLRLPRCVATLPDSDVVVCNSLPSLQVQLDETKVPERETAVLSGIDKRTAAYPSGSFPPITDAAILLSQCWADEYEDLKMTLRVVVPRIAPAGWKMDGFTLSTAQGAVWINPNDMLTAFESLVHEQSHVKLRYLEEAVPILEAEQPEARFLVGWRTDSRPIVGLYEGVYVHIHCALAFQRALHTNMIPTSLRNMTGQRLHALVSNASEALYVLQHNARFTDPGVEYVRWAQAQLMALREG